MTRAVTIGWVPFANDPAIASVRLRCFFPVRYLRQAGWDCEVFRVRRMERYDIVVFQKAYSSEALELAARLKRRGTKIVFDLCDNHFYNPRGNRELAERAARLTQMLEVCDAVAVSSPETARLIKNKPTHVIDDTLDPFVPGPFRRTLHDLFNRRQRDRLSLVWFGNAGGEDPPFGLAQVSKLVPILEELAAEMPLGLTVISNSRENFDKVLGEVSFPCVYKDWTLSKFPYLFRRHDICLIPIELNDFTICKTANRLAQSLLLGVPVVADPIPSFMEFSPYVLFSDWRRNLRRYATDRGLRETHVREGGEYVREKYTPDRAVEEWSALFRDPRLTA